MTRVDKWLWAARFFRTRAKAKEAIDGGKVHVNGQRTKPARDVKVGDELRIRQGWDEKTVIVDELSEHRGGAPQAALLYTETVDSQQKREDHALQRKLAGGQVASHNRPNKRQRRQIHRFREGSPRDGGRE